VVADALPRPWPIGILTGSAIAIVIVLSIREPPWTRGPATRRPSIKEIRDYQRVVGWWHTLVLLLLALSALALGGYATSNTLDEIGHKSLDAGDTATVITAIADLISAGCLGAAAVIRALAEHLKARTGMATVLAGVKADEERQMTETLRVPQERDHRHGLD
jgi:hypothetical protein